MPQAMHRHLCRKIAGFGRKIVSLRHDVAATPDFLQDSLPTLYQSVEGLGIVFGVINDDPLIPFHAHLVVSIGPVLSRKPPVDGVLGNLFDAEWRIFFLIPAKTL